MRIKFKSIVIALLFLSGFAAKATDGLVKKEKKISKAYNVNADAIADIKNKYGNIYVATWDENKIQIDVVITVEGRDEKKVDKRLSSIDVAFEALKAKISAKTIFGGEAENKTNMEVNYTVRIPRKGSIDLNNKYGNIIVDRISGYANIDCQYGNLTIGDLQGDINSIRLKYCDKTTIGSAKSITLDSQYSNVNLKKADNIIYSGDYSNFSAQETGKVIYKGDYGELFLGEVDDITIRGDYLTMKIVMLNKNLASNTSYSNLNLGIAAKANNVAINGDYSNFEIRYDADYSFDFDIALRYTDLKSSGLTFQSKKESGTSSNYKGFYKSAGKNKLNIALEYGDLKLIRI
ncbi:DUF4097 family beta strand repeat-containing protein [Flavobacterium pallidum]|uniref:Adhesin domain-containing protein n=1 Tax=Flavobacterium pallidum TaxID=2172098 RepID=A0A2S1SJ26_9FLAO|nr:DUF4097 family beta strand repeat-containing protein [Flavobacterium pallidum]AWI26396.1 hypothetical protein HYN49_11055 [Flavobacterium pallidum]